MSRYCGVIVPMALTMAIILTLAMMVSGQGVEGGVKSGPAQMEKEGTAVPFLCHAPSPVSAQVSADGRWVAVADDTGGVSIWDVMTDGESPLHWYYSGGLGKAVFTADSRYIVRPDGDLWPVYAFDGGSWGPAGAGAPNDESWRWGPVAAHPERRVVAVCDVIENRVTLRSVPELSLLDSLKIGPDLSDDHRRQPIGVAFMGPDFVAVGSHDGTLQLLSTETLREVRSVEVDVDILVRICSDVAGQHVIGAPWNTGDLRRWACSGDEPVETFCDVGARVDDLVHHPTRDELLCVRSSEAGRSSAMLWNSADGVLLRSYDFQVDACAFHPTEPWVVLAESSASRVVQRDTGELLRTLTPHRHINIANHTGHRFTVYVKGPYSDTLVLDAGNSRTIATAPPGPYKFHAVAAEGGRTHTFEADLRPGGLWIELCPL